MDVCVVCLENNDEIHPRIDITSQKWKDSNMQHIIEKHLWWWFLRQPINKDHKQWLCNQCWEEISSFNTYADRVKKSHKSYRASMKRKIDQVFNEIGSNKVAIIEEAGGGVGIVKEPNRLTEDRPQHLVPIEKTNIQTDEISIVHVKKELQSYTDLTESLHDPMQDDTEEILPNSEFSITHITDPMRNIPEKSIDNLDKLPNINTIAELGTLLQQQHNLNKKIYMGINDLKKSISNQSSSFINVLNNQISALKSSVHSHFEAPKFTTLFPINSEEELYAFENIITEENKTEIISSVKRIIGPKGIEKGICHIFSMELLYEYNVNGIYGKKRLMDYEKTMNVLFLASAAEGRTSLVEFNIQLRKAIKTAKNRYFKNEFMKRKKVNDASFELYEENSMSVQNEPGCSTYT